MTFEDFAREFVVPYESEDYAACSAFLEALSSGSKRTDAATLAQSLPALRQAFRSRLRDPGVGADVALEYLVHCGDAGAEFLLEWLAEEEEKRIRSRIIGLAEKLDRQHVLKATEKRLGDPRWFVVRNMVTIAGRLDLPDSVSFMERALRHDDVRVAKEVVKVLFKSVSDVNAPLVLALLHHQDKSVRLQALRLVMLFGLEKGEAVPSLHKLAVADPVPEVRTLASSILG